MARARGRVEAVVGALAAAKSTDYSSLALMGNAATTVLGRDAGRGFVTGAGLQSAGSLAAAATRQLLTGGEPSVDPKRCIITTQAQLRLVRTRKPPLPIACDSCCSIAGICGDD